MAIPSEMPPYARTCEITPVRSVVSGKAEPIRPQYGTSQAVYEMPHRKNTTPKNVSLPASGRSGTANSRVVSSATGNAENRMNGRILPQRVRVLSMTLPMMGSLTASKILVAVRMPVTTAIPATVMCAYCSR